MRYRRNMALASSASLQEPPPSYDDRKLDMLLRNADSKHSHGGVLRHR